MIDFHTHILPNVDDGASSIEEAIEMIKFLKARGFNGVVATPHANSLYYPKREILQEKRNEILKNEDFKIIIGYEVRIDAIEVFDIQYFLIEGTNYILLELNFLEKPKKLIEPFIKVMKFGLRPIIAHPERYHYLSIEEIKEIRDLGVILQVNLKSLKGFYGNDVREKALKIFDICDLIGSDAHSIKDYEKLNSFELYEKKDFSKFILNTLKF
ncbi:MAG: CpsB/CapC family capsule biosynthesis tyrosine phosphatase [candidate division WOR-3 bacterium]